MRPPLAASAIRSWCLRTKTTQSQLADQVGITRAALVHHLSGRYLPTLDTAVRYQDVTGVPADQWARWPTEKSTGT